MAVGERPPWIPLKRNIGKPAKRFAGEDFILSHTCCVWTIKKNEHSLTRTHQFLSRCNICSSCWKKEGGINHSLTSDAKCCGHMFDPHLLDQLVPEYTGVVTPAASGVYLEVGPLLSEPGFLSTRPPSWSITAQWQKEICSVSTRGSRPEIVYFFLRPENHFFTRAALWTSA